MTGLRLVVVVASLAVAPRVLPAEGAPPAGPAAPAAAGDGGSVRFTLDLSLGLGGGNATGDGEPFLSAGAHATIRPGRFLLAGNAEVATNFIGSTHGFLTAGVGGWRKLEVGQVAVMGLFGTHAMVVDDWSGPDTEHRLKVLGIRAAWEGSFGNRVVARTSVAASAYFDLEREYDATVDQDVGGTTVLVSVALGLGG